MQHVRHRFSSTAAASPAGCYDSNLQPPPPPPRVEEFYIGAGGGGVEEEFSSDATVRYQDSEPDDDIQNIVYERRNQQQQLLEKHLREQQQQAIPYRARLPNVPQGFEKCTGGMNLAVQRQGVMPIGGRIPIDGFQRELFQRRRGPTLSWGFQQDLADYEASLQKSEMIRAGGMMYQPAQQPQSQTGGYVIRNDFQPVGAKQPKRRGKGGKKEQVRDAQIVDMQHIYGNVIDGNVVKDSGQQQQQKPAKSRRRGRRGGRGRKNVERPTDDVPKLEKNLEDELAQEMASHISSKSPIAHSFSSLRLHVAGGDTMIILNDKEITGLDAPSSHNEFAQRAKLADEGTSSRSELRDKNERHLQTEAEQERVIGIDNARVPRPKGCGTYFPPQVLEQVQRGSPQASSFVSQPSTPSAPVAARVAPITPSEPTRTIERLVLHQPRAKPGTGCYFPVYSQNAASPETDPSQNLESVSFSESLAALENTDDIRYPSQEANSTGDLEFSEATELSRSDVSSPLVIKEPKSCHGTDDLRKLRGSRCDPSKNLMQLMENEECTVFMSPLHLEDTLDGLQAEREAREETEQKLINLQIENEELRSTVQNLEKTETELQQYKCTLQAMLFCELQKNRRARIRNAVPLGLHPPPKLPRAASPPKHPILQENHPSEHESTAAAAPRVVVVAEAEEKKEVASNPLNAAKIKRPKSQLKSTSGPKPAELKRTTRPDKRTTTSATANGAKVSGEASKKKDPASMEEAKTVDLEPKLHSTTIKSATATSGSKKLQQRSKSRNQSTDDTGEDVRKNKTATPSRSITKQHSRAVSSSNNAL